MFSSSGCVLRQFCIFSCVSVTSIRVAKSLIFLFKSFNSVFCPLHTRIINTTVLAGYSVHSTGCKHGPTCSVDILNDIFNFVGMVLFFSLAHSLYPLRHDVFIFIHFGCYMIFLLPPTIYRGGCTLSTN